MNRPIATQLEHGQHAFQALLSARTVRDGQDALNATIGFAIYAATVTPADLRLPLRFTRGIDFAGEAAFLRRLATHFDATAAEFETLAQLGSGITTAQLETSHAA